MQEVDRVGGGAAVKKIAEPYLDRLDKLLTDYLRAIQTPN